MKVVPRQPGDASPPLSEIVADALRKAGKDPAKFVLAPGESGDLSHLGLPAAGRSVEHTFLFTDRADALRCVEQFADRGPVTIAKDAQGWWVTIAGSGDDPSEHARLAAAVTSLGGQDRGVRRMTVTTKFNVK